MDWVKYYQDQINKSTYNRLNKVEDFTGNQTKGQEGGFYTFIPFWVIKKIQDHQNEKVEDFTGNQTSSKARQRDPLFKAVNSYWLARFGRSARQPISIQDMHN